MKKIRLNTCYNEDVFDTIKKCKKEGLKFKMIWADPDYNVNINYTGKTYTKKWLDYIKWYAELTSLCIEILEDDGHLFLLNYPKPNSHLRAKYLESPELQDLEFNSSKKINEVAEYVWIYNSNIGMSNKHFTTAHRTILHVTKSKKSLLNKSIYLPYKNIENVKNKTIKKNIISYLIAKRKIKYQGSALELREIRNKTWKLYLENKVTEYEKKKIKEIENDVINTSKEKGRKLYSWITMDELQNIKTNSNVYHESNVLYHDLLKNVSKHKTIHPCQVPPELFSSIVSSSTKKNDNIFILFGGSGEELIKSAELQRNFISAEIHKKYYKMIISKIK
jgi:site-specific DNA-methyltransferase (adenine-specific)